MNDNNNKGFNEWEFMTTHNWGEYAKGEWILEIENGYRACKFTCYNEWLCVQIWLNMVFEWQKL